MSEIRRKLLTQETEKDNHIFDIHLETSNMYDAVSGFPITLGSIGVYNSTYNCLQKNTGGSSSVGAGVLSLINHPCRNRRALDYTSTSECIFKVLFIAPNLDSFDNFVSCGFPGVTASWNWGDVKAEYRLYLQPYSFDKVFNWEWKQIGGNPISYKLFDNNGNLLHSSTQATSINFYLQRFVNLFQLYNSLLLLPSWYSPQRNSRFYMKRFEMIVNE